MVTFSVDPVNSQPYPTAYVSDDSNKSPIDNFFRPNSKLISLITRVEYPLYLTLVLPDSVIYSRVTSYS